MIPLMGRRPKTPLEILRSTELLDPAWYRESHADLRGKPLDAAKHYLEHGAADGRNPSLFFDTKWYLEHTPEAGSSINPLVHYLQRKSYVGACPHPLFDVDFYLSQIDGNALQADPLTHYLTVGWMQGLRPSRYFDPVWYLKEHPNVRKLGLEPLTHFVSFGWKEGHNPNPLFDVKFYLSQVRDVVNVDPLSHYLTTGWKSGIATTARSADFDRLQISGADIMTPPTYNAVHNLKARIGRGEVSSFDLYEIFNALIHQSDHLLSYDFDDLKPDSDEFDEAAYLASYPDVKAALERGAISSGREHWLVCGFKEELNGSRDGSWRAALSLSSLKTMIGSIVQGQQGGAIEANGIAHAQYVMPHVKRWNKVSRMVNALRDRPLISVLMPVYNVDVKWLTLAIESVYWQIYPNWELCIVDDCSTNPEISKLLKRWAAQDCRIKVKLRTENGHVSVATNDALAMAEGDYVALLDHDDELTVDALARVACYMGNHRDAEYIFSDDDKVDEAGNVYGRFFKPDWSPELILNCGYTTHLSVFRKSAVIGVGGFRSKYDGAQDYDLILRVTAGSPKVGHIAEVLYHWRAIETSTALSRHAKSYAYPRAKAALAEHMQRIGFPGKTADGVLGGYTRPIFDIVGEPLISIVIPTAGKIVDVRGTNTNLLENCIRSIRKRSSWPHVQIIVSDNGNLSPETIEKLTDLNVHMVSYRSENFNLAEKLNLAAQHADGEYLILLNDDIEVISSDWIEQMLQYQQQPKIGTVGAKLLFADRTIQHIGVSIIGGMPGHPYYGAEETTIGHGGLCATVHNVVAVTGACMMTPRVLYEQLGGYDTSFDLNYNDVDYCLRAIDAGYRNVMNPFAVLWHYESQSRDNARSVRTDEIERFLARWGERYQREPFLRAS